MQRHSCGSKVAMMVGLYLYSVVVGLLLHLLIATTQLSELEGASTDAQSPSATLLSFFLSLQSSPITMVGKTGERA